MEPFLCVPSLSLPSLRSWHCWDPSATGGDCNLSPVPAREPHTASPHTHLCAPSSEQDSCPQKAALGTIFKQSNINGACEPISSQFLPALKHLFPLFTLLGLSKMGAVFFFSGKRKEKQKKTSALPTLAILVPQYLMFFFTPSPASCSNVLCKNLRFHFKKRRKRNK